MTRAESRTPSADTDMDEQAPAHNADERIVGSDWLLAHAADIPWQELVGGKLISRNGARLEIVEVLVRAKLEPLIHVKIDLEANGQVARYNLAPFRTGRFEGVAVGEARSEAVTSTVQRAEDQRQLEATRLAEARDELEHIRQEEIRCQKEKQRLEARRHAREQLRAEKSRQEKARRREENRRQREVVERARINASRQFDLLLFDLDDTLLETGCLEAFRGKANLSRQDSGYLTALLESSEKVRPIIEQGMLEMLQDRFPDMAIGVFSRAPRAYVDALLEAFYPRVRWDCVVAYQDVGGATKPAPNGIRQAMTLAGVQDVGRVAVVGDDSVDVLAAYQAGAVAIILTKAWGVGWSQDRSDPSRAGHFRTMSYLPDAVLDDPAALPSAVVEPWALLPALEAWDRSERLGSGSGGRIAKINHFPPSSSAKGWVTCHVLGRYFSTHSSWYDFAPRRADHSVTRCILDAKDGRDYPESWVACCRSHVLEQVSNSRASTSPVIVCPVPARPERSQRLEWLLDRLRESLSDTDGIVVDNEILRFSIGAQANKELDRVNRFRNIEKHLTVAKKEAVVGATVVVIDDVTTTGATFYFADRYLRNAGATRVHCVALTQTIS